MDDKSGIREAKKDEFKLFVGGLSYKMDDAGLREGAFNWCSPTEKLAVLTHLCLAPCEYIGPKSTQHHPVKLPITRTTTAAGSRQSSEILDTVQACVSRLLPSSLCAHS